MFSSSFFLVSLVVCVAIGEEVWVAVAEKWLTSMEGVDGQRLAVFFTFECLNSLRAPMVQESHVLQSNTLLSIPCKQN